MGTTSTFGSSLCLVCLGLAPASKLTIRTLDTDTVAALPSMVNRNALTGDPL
jgi:hypothetical protein